MMNYRIVLLSFLAALWVFLSGFKLPVKNDSLAIDNQKTTVELKLAVAENTDSPPETKKTVKVSPQKTKQKRITTTVDDRNELESPLDLSVPFKGFENNDLEKKWAEPIETISIFPTDSQKNPRPLELNGGLLMSPEPQAEKRKTIDGAGIVINIKP
jgi:hypothetical protein